MKFIIIIIIIITYKSPLLTSVESSLNEFGLSGMWLNQFELHFSQSWIQSKMIPSLKDQYVQNVLSDNDSKDNIYCNYRLFKSVFDIENSLNVYNAKKNSIYTLEL